MNMARDKTPGVRRGAGGRHAHFADDTEKNTAVESKPENLKKPQARIRRVPRKPKFSTLSVLDRAAIFGSNNNHNSLAASEAEDDDMDSHDGKLNDKVEASQQGQDNFILQLLTIEQHHNNNASPEAQKAIKRRHGHLLLERSRIMRKAKRAWDKQLSFDLQQSAVDAIRLRLLLKLSRITVQFDIIRRGFSFADECRLERLLDDDYQVPFFADKRSVRISCQPVDKTCTVSNGNYPQQTEEQVFAVKNVFERRGWKHF